MQCINIVKHFHGLAGWILHLTNANKVTTNNLAAWLTVLQYLIPLLPANTDKSTISML
jgi:hypothetical protein